MVFHLVQVKKSGSWNALLHERFASRPTFGIIRHEPSCSEWDDSWSRRYLGDDILLQCGVKLFRCHQVRVESYRSPWDVGTNDGVIARSTGWTQGYRSHRMSSHRYHIVNQVRETIGSSGKGAAHWVCYLMRELDKRGGVFERPRQVCRETEGLPITVTSLFQHHRQRARSSEQKVTDPSPSQVWVTWSPHGVGIDFQISPPPNHPTNSHPSFNNPLALPPVRYRSPSPR